MSYGTHTFWEIYSFGLHPTCGTAVAVIAFVILMVASRDHPERRLFWVSTILAISLLGFCIGEWEREANWLNRWEEHGGFFDPVKLDEWMTRSTPGRMMFMAQAGLAITFALALLWWPIRSKED